MINKRGGFSMVEADAMITIKCDCGHTTDTFCLAGKPFEYECDFCGKKWLIIFEVKKINE